MDLHNAQKATLKIRELERIKNLLVLLALLLIVGCAGHLATFTEKDWGHDAGYTF